MLSLRQFRCSRLSALLRPLCTEASKSAPKTESRWQRLKRERRKAPTPENRKPAFDRTATYSLTTALSHIRSSSWAKFDESLELNMLLNIDPRHADQNLRGVVNFPHGTGRVNKVAAFVEDAKDEKEAREAGADMVCGLEMIDEMASVKAKSLKGYRATVCAPETLGKVAAKLGRLLGPKGLLPNEKDGTVGHEIGDLVKSVKGGWSKWRTDKMGNVQMSVGKISWDDAKLQDNVMEAVRIIISMKPASVKRKYIKKIVVGSTMGPSVTLDAQDLVRQSMSTNASA